MEEYSSDLEGYGINYSLSPTLLYSPSSQKDSHRKEGWHCQATDVSMKKCVSVWVRDCVSVSERV